MSDLAGIEDIAEQTGVRVSQRMTRGHYWSISPNIERASASRENKPQPPQVAAKAEVPDAPIHIFSAAEVTTYSELIEGIKGRLAELGIRYQDFDSLADFPAGLSGKAFGPSQVKRLGPEKLFDALRAASLKIRIEPDAEQLEKMRRHMEEHCQPRQANQARMNNNNYARPSEQLVDRVLKYLTSNDGGLTLLNNAAREARSRLARHAARARWEKRRAVGHVDFERMLPAPEQRA